MSFVTHIEKRTIWISTGTFVKVVTCLELNLCTWWPWRSVADGWGEQGGTEGLTGEFGTERSGMTGSSAGESTEDWLPTPAISTNSLLSRMDQSIC